MTNSELTEGIKEESRGLVSIFFDAVRGVKHDYTSGPIGRAVLLLAIPMVLETLMESIFAVVDVFFVSRLGAGAVATVGLTESVMMLIYTVAMGLGIGVAAIVARRIGERDADGAGDGAAQAVFLGLVIATVIGIVGGVFAPDILRLMGGDAEVLAGVAYTRILMGGNATVLLLFLINAAFRGAGDATIAMRVLWLANGINLVLDPVLIFGLGPFPRMELAGAATATTIGRGTAVLLQLYLLVKGSGNLRVKREHVRPNWSLMWRMVKLSATGTFQIFIGSA
ncbi:MAG: MATE family efflux transporter, partial [Gemmatimonadota bacterium]|nr:MATE family efflux transporter [Gemmatimonadota bacterium]